MTERLERLDRLRAAVRRPLPLAYHPLYRFYEGGSLTCAPATDPVRSGCSATTCCSSSTAPRWRWRTRSTPTTGASASRWWRRVLAGSTVTSAVSRSAAARRMRCPRACRSVSGPGASRYVSSAASARQRSEQLQEVLMPDAAPLLAEYRDRAMRQYGQAVGRRREDLVTPALVLDIDAAQRNIDRMASELRRIGPTTIRPHYKTHKSPDLARRQVQAGARGLSMATVWEAAVLAAAGFDDLFVVNTVAHPDKIRLLAELARDRRILVAVDEAANAAAHSAAAVRAGSTVGIFIEVDTGMNRCGVDTEAEALALARAIGELPGLRLEGITGYEGHCTLTPEEDLRHSKQQQAMQLFTGVADLLEANGIACPIRSAGGIATWHWTAAYPGITEIQAGSYVVMDNFHGKMVPGFEHSLTIQGSVISRQSKQVIVDVGKIGRASCRE